MKAAIVLAIVFIAGAIAWLLMGNYMWDVVRLLK